MELQPRYIEQTHLLEMVDLPFIEANTIPMDLEEIQHKHIIPVFTKDNQALISQHEFIQEVKEVITSMHTGAMVGPYIRVSHPVKGRIPSARHKKVSDLLPEEETIYYERMMFVFVIPSITREIDGKELKLVIGGIKAYNKDNFNRKGNSPQHFSFFIGFQVRVCSNLCIWSDGAKECIQVNTLHELRLAIMDVLGRYNPEIEIDFMKTLGNYSMNVKQVAHLIGKGKLYPYLSKSEKFGIIPPGLNDTQINLVSRQYFMDDHFAQQGGEISLWSLYNLFTGALKSSYIDTCMENHLVTGTFFKHLVHKMDRGESSWYLVP